jgi:hypothetical protein
MNYNYLLLKSDYSEKPKILHMLHINLCYHIKIMIYTCVPSCHDSKKTFLSYCSTKNWFEIVKDDTAMPETKALLCNQQITQWLTNVRWRGGMTSLINNSALSLRKFGCGESTCSYRPFCSATTLSLYRSKWPPDVCNRQNYIPFGNISLTQLHGFAAVLHLMSRLQ